MKMKMDNRTVAIIGGGIAGLTAGIYLQQYGFHTTIYEKNKIVGGQCTGWSRDDHFIDNCIHWLTGTRKGSDLHELWKNVGALDNSVHLIKKDMFFQAELGSEKITFWRDLERTRQEMLKLSPEDADEINKFIDYTKLAETMEVPVSKPFDMMNPLEYIKLGKSMAGMGKVIKEYGRIDIKELSERFVHPLLRLAMRDYMPEGYQAFALMVSYGTITGQNGDIPQGGSLQMVLRMKKRYEELGGKVLTNSPVKKINIDKSTAASMELEYSQVVHADYFVCACDTDFTFGHLLDAKYMPSSLRDAYEHRELYPVISGFQIAFSVDGIYEKLHGNQLFDCKPLEIAGRKIQRISMMNYDYDDFAPEGKCVIQTNIMQTERDYQYWKELSMKPDEYKKEKERIANEVMERHVAHYSFLQGKISIIDTWTPVTYSRYCNSFHGAYMSFIITKKAKNKIIPGKIKGLKNVVIASQWLMGPGGLPTAAAMGKFAAQRINSYKD